MDFVVVCGVEKMTDMQDNEVTAALASAADADFEVMHGVSFVALNALLMRRYMYEYRVKRATLPFSPSTRTERGEQSVRDVPDGADEPGL